MSSVFAFESHYAVARTQIKSFFIVQFELCVACFHNTGTANIVDTHFATGEEERSFQRINRFERQHLSYRKRTTYHHTVVHGIYHIHFIGDKYLFD